MKTHLWRHYFLRLVELAPDEFIEAHDAWDEALRESRDNNVFLTWEWITLWRKRLGEKVRFSVVTVIDDGRIVAAAPIARWRRFLGLGPCTVKFGDTDESDYNAFVITKKTPDAAKMLLDHIVSAANLFELGNIPEGSETAAYLRTYSKESFKFLEDVDNICSYISLPNKWEDYFSSLSHYMRRDLVRDQRNLEADFNVDFRIVSKSSEAGQAMNAFFDLHERRLRVLKRNPAISVDRSIRDFHLDVASSFAEKGWLFMGLLTLDDETVACAYAFKYANKLYGYLSGFDPEYSKYGIGSLLHMNMIKCCIDEHLEEYDFLRGDEPYKRRWTPLARRLVRFSARKGILGKMFGRNITTTDTLRKA
jgi:CelD/BcsL family acetyltransferase involved in cellulose biosynthesis